MRRPAKKVRQVVALQRVLELRVARAAADLDLLHGLQKERGARNASQLGPQPVGDLERADLAHVERLQRDIDAGEIVSSDEAGHDVDRRIRADNRDVLHSACRAWSQTPCLPGPGRCH